MRPFGIFSFRPFPLWARLGSAALCVALAAPAARADGSSALPFDEAPAPLTTGAVHGLSADGAGAGIAAPSAVAPALSPAPAKPPAWLGGRFSLSIQDHPLGSVLREFAGAAGAAVRISQAVPADTKVNERFEAVTGRQFLDQLSRSYGFDWRFDGAQIEVSAVSERESRLAALKGASLEDLETAMRRLGLWEEKFKPRTDGSIVYFNGPPRYVASLETVLAELVAARQQAAAKAEEQKAAEKARAAEEMKAALARAGEEWARAEAEARRRAEMEAQPPKVLRGGIWSGS